MATGCQPEGSFENVGQHCLPILLYTLDDGDCEKVINDLSMVQISNLEAGCAELSIPADSVQDLLNGFHARSLTSWID